jgi:hypothetical protein
MTTLSANKIIITTQIVVVATITWLLLYAEARIVPVLRFPANSASIKRCLRLFINRQPKIETRRTDAGDLVSNLHIACLHEWN